MRVPLVHRSLVAGSPTRRSSQDADLVGDRLRAVLRTGWVPRADLGLPNAGRVDRIGEEPDVALLDRSARGDDTDRPASGPAGLLRRFRWEPSRPAAALMVLIALLAAAVTGVVVWHARPVSQPVAPLPSSVPSAVPFSGAARSSSGPPVTAAVPSASRIAVAVAGRVRHPGVVEVPVGSRVVDAIAAAGGVAPGAHLGLLNLAKVLIDGEQVVVGVPGVSGAGPPADGGPAGSGGVGPAEPVGPVNLNTATLDQLETLPGVGPSTAQKILDWRTSNGSFQSVDQLQDVSGIGPAKYAAIAPKATV